MNLTAQGDVNPLASEPPIWAIALCLNFAVQVFGSAALALGQRLWVAGEPSR